MLYAEICPRVRSHNARPFGQHNSIVITTLYVFGDLKKLNLSKMY